MGLLWTCFLCLQKMFTEHFPTALLGSPTKRVVFLQIWLAESESVSSHDLCASFFCEPRALQPLSLQIQIPLEGLGAMIEVRSNTSI